MKDGFYLSLRFMFGDADYYATETHYFSPDNIDGLVNIVDLCEVLCGYDNFGSYEKTTFIKRYLIFLDGEMNALTENLITDVTALPHWTRIKSPRLNMV